MQSDKIVKKKFKEVAKKNPDRYYAVDVLQRYGFKRNNCPNCNTYFWSVNDSQKTCGDASCQGGFTFLDKPTSKQPLSYVEVWKRFAKQFSSYTYSVIQRFPVVARWNPTMDFTIASIAAFQPFVVSGEAKAPAEKLVIPQFCLRFGDVDNVGITMSHLTGFVMIGQHQFVAPKDWDQNKAFEEIFAWLTEGLGLDKKDITFHEDAWAGGGNFGPCMEFFSSGVELGNQVYMMFEQDDESDVLFDDVTGKELSLKVLDMGMGMERNAWFSQASDTIYDATFPQVIEKLLHATQFSPDRNFIRSYVPYGAYLNLDEVEDIAQAWEDVSSKMGVSVKDLKEKLEPMTAIYTVAEHARSLLFALCDGGLPSNVGGGYNLRVILRRALSAIEKYNWNIDLYDVCTWHAEELKEIFPELSSSLADVKKILASEKRKYIDGKKRNKQLIEQILKKGIPTLEKLLELYDSHGIMPEEVVKIDKQLHGVSSIAIPENFFQLISERQEQKEAQNQTKREIKIPINQQLPRTEILYYDDWKTDTFEAKIIDVYAKENEVYLVFDKTAFYPTSGGQIHDLGTINGIPLLDCIKQQQYILHKVADKATSVNSSVHFKIGDNVTGKIDMAHREQLTQHHTGTHIINGAAKAVLGNHIWQAGASKSEKKGRLDITHYDALSDEELLAIEKEANIIIQKKIPITKTLLPRDIAEKKYGFRLYQGGAVPGNEIRVVAIADYDIEACGGTHLNNTSEAKQIKILKSSKVQDGVVRIEFVAGNAAEKELNKSQDVLSEICKQLDCESTMIPSRCEELFSKWKKAKKGSLNLEEFELRSNDRFSGDVLIESARILRTQPEHVLNTVQKFKKQLDDFKAKL